MLSVLILVGQTLLYALWAFLMVPMLVSGIGPDTVVSESRAEALTAFYRGVGTVLVALNIWICGRMVRTLRHGTSSATPLSVACVIEALIVARAVLVGWPEAVAGATAVLVVLVACHRLDRRAFGARGPGALREEAANVCRGEGA
ncbi:MAG TPA: hypothetical protein VFY14_13190 [Streptomyces sp.]|nr:hypothetical protein [Streptomyces sp.]